MTNFEIVCSNAWLLLLLIPAYFITLFPYFRMQKKYRRTRNRIISVVLHSIVMTLCIFVFAGMTFEYDVPNKDNEIMLVVDSSYSLDVDDEKDEFIQSLIDAKGESYKLGIVTFGYNQVYAAPLSDDVGDTFDKYMSSERPDDSASDIASALAFAQSKFKNPKTAKIVLISDGMETDGEAVGAVKSIAAQGTRVDTVRLGKTLGDKEVQIVGITTPDYTVARDDEFDISVTLKSSYVGSGNIRLYDNDKACAYSAISLVEGEQTITLAHKIDLPGLHRIRFELTGDGDTLIENNSYYTYIYISVYDNLLIISRSDDEAAQMKKFLASEFENVDVVNISDAKNMPTTVDKLCEYDEVVLLNISGADMDTSKGFIDILHSYVYDMGGGLLTVGGNKDNTVPNPEPNMYNRDDMYHHQTYQQMLPVQAVDYTPPLGVVIIIDRSGSMTSLLTTAQNGAISCVDGVLEERDFCGIMTLETYYNEELKLTPMTEKHKIIEAISDIEIGGGTVYTGAIKRAGEALRANNSVEKRHIMLITDGEPGDTYDDYAPVIKSNYETAGITFSIVVVGGGGSHTDELKRAAEEVGHGRYYNVPDGNVPQTMREDLNVPEITEISKEPFYPVIRDQTSVVNGVPQEEIYTSGLQLGGYYGVKLKSGAKAPLMVGINTKEGQVIQGFSPLYAQWDYGEGSVGSFMCDLSGVWSSGFLAHELGQKLLHNMVYALFPDEELSSSDISARITEDNYSTHLSVYTKLNEGETLEVTVSPPETESSDATPSVMTFGAKDNYSRVTFSNLQSGIHTVTIKKKDAAGESISEYTTYRSFSYSKEFDVFADTQAGVELMGNITRYGGGEALDRENYYYAFEDVDKYLHRSADPRLAFIIIAVVLFLLDIAVRKFKFKWIHELVREHRAKKDGNVPTGTLR